MHLLSPFLLNPHLYEHKKRPSYYYQNNRIYVKIQRSSIIGGTQIITNKRKTHLFDKKIHFSMQFSAVLNIFIVKNSIILLLQMI